MVLSEPVTRGASGVPVNVPLPITSPDKPVSNWDNSGACSSHNRSSWGVTLPSSSREFTSETSSSATLLTAPSVMATSPLPLNG